jgi:hypothetical protein
MSSVTWQHVRERPSSPLHCLVDEGSKMDDPQELSGVVAALFDPAFSDFGDQPVAQADPSASGTAIRRWFRSGE